MKTPNALSAAARSFDWIRPDNPLRSLHPEDRIALWALLTLYDRASQDDAAAAITDALESVGKISSDLAKLAGRLEAEVFSGPLSAGLEPTTRAFRGFPAALAILSAKLSSALNEIGKPGHKYVTFPNLYLVAASEFVRLKAGQYYDEHVAALFQAIQSGCSPRDFTGDAIRRKRENMQKRHGALYQAALDEARSHAKPT